MKFFFYILVISIALASNLCYAYEDIEQSELKIPNLIQNNSLTNQLNPMKLPDIDPITNPASDNWLTQEIAKQVGKDNIADLTQQDFNKINKFTFVEAKVKEIPKEIGNLFNVTYIGLRDNQIMDIPKEMFNLSNLEFLHLAENQISEIPKEISTLVNLKFLYLERNEIDKIPNEVFNLSNLETLQVAYNNLNKLSFKINNSSNLKELILYHNQISEIPNEIRNLYNLTNLDLSYNYLISLPGEIKNLSNITSLSLGYNQLKSIPSAVINLPNLGSLELNDNQIVEIPNEIKNLDKLKVLKLEKQTITLPSKSIISNEAFSIPNPIKVFDNYVMPQEISNQGTYDDTSKSITWLVSDDRNEESFKFSEDIKVNYTNIEFSGTVYQPLIIDNTDKKAKLEQSIKDAQAVLDGDNTTGKIIKAIYDLSKAIQEYNK